jgi:hypothetical protein
VYVVLNGRRWTSPDDARFLADLTEPIWTRVDRRAPWRSATEREQFHAEIERARAEYESLALQAGCDAPSCLSSRIGEAPLSILHGEAMCELFLHSSMASFCAVKVRPTFRFAHAG